jgi:hypothetical protein
VTILAVDVGTTDMKMGIFRNNLGSLPPVHQFSQTFEINGCAAGFKERSPV